MEAAENTNSKTAKATINITPLKSRSEALVRGALDEDEKDETAEDEDFGDLLRSGSDSPRSPGSSTSFIMVGWKPSPVRANRCLLRGKDIVLEAGRFGVFVGLCLPINQHTFLSNGSIFINGDSGTRF